MMKLLCLLVFTMLTTALCRPEITKDTKVELPGSEKINRRSPHDNFQLPSKLKFDTAEEQKNFESKATSVEDLYFSFAKRSENSVPSENEDMMEAESGLVFRPLFHTKDRGFRPRSQRSVQEDEQENAVKSAESSIVYVPLFGARDIRDELKNRIRRSSDNAKKIVIGSPIDLQTPENIVFKPLLKNKQRLVRSDSESIFGSKLVFQNQYS